MDKIAAGLEELTQGITHGLSNMIPGRRRSQSSAVASPSHSHSIVRDAPDAPNDGVDFEVEEEQVMKGLDMVYHDKLNEADEYFETLKVDPEQHHAQARFSLHHAEISSYVALMSSDPEDVKFAISLLQQTISIAVEQSKRWRTNSKLQKVAEAAQETVEAMKTWALKSAATALSKAGSTGAQVSAMIMPQQQGHEQESSGFLTPRPTLVGGNPAAMNVGDMEDFEEEGGGRSSSISVALRKQLQAVTGAGGLGSGVSGNEPENTREEVSRNHRAHRMRLWALLIQGECHLMTSLLQIVEIGESWSDVMMMGYNVRRIWNIYQHCQNKLKQLQNEWVALGGTFVDVGELRSNVNLDFEDDSSDDEAAYITDKMDPSGASSSHQHHRHGHHDDPRPKRSRSQIQNYDPLLAPPTGEMNMVYEGVRAAAGNLEKLDGDGDGDGDVDVKEDQELASLRIGIQFGIGAFNLLVSLIPTTYQKAIELIGVPGDRNLGLAILRKVSCLHHSRAPLAAILLLQYYTTIMGLLPYSEENAIGAKNILNLLPLAWKDSSIFRVLKIRLSIYEGRLSQSATLLEQMYTAMAKEEQKGGLVIKLKNFVLAELGWALFLQGDFVKASEVYGVLYKKTQALKPMYGFIQLACFWEADEKYHHDAAKILRDIPGMLTTKSSAPTSMEQLAQRIANDFMKYGQAPLFPALETIALYNGFHHMDKVTLKKHIDRVSDALMSKSPKRASEYINISDVDSLTGSPSSELRGPSPSLSPTSSPTNHSRAGNSGGGVAMGGDVIKGRSIAFKSKSKISVPELEDEDDEKTPITLEGASSPRIQTTLSRKFNHKWTKESKVLCRYLLALCQRSLGDTKQAGINFCYVVGQNDIPPRNVVPYACYEWGSLMLNIEATSAEGLNMLEKSLQFPPHEFQTRLKFVVSECLKMFRRACETSLSTDEASTTSALNLRRVSELLRTVSTTKD